jgi:hypothetical protein
MQNEPNFGKAQMNVNKVLTKDYEEKCGKDLWKNEPKTNPIKANFKTEVRKQKTEDSKISAKSTPKLRFIVPTNFFYNCREFSTNRPYFMQNKANFQKVK